MASGEPLFSSEDKLNKNASGAKYAYPCFSKTINDKVILKSYDCKPPGIPKTRLVCAVDEINLGNQYPEGTLGAKIGGARYELNSSSLQFTPYE